MINKLLFKLSADLPCRLISLDGRPYLERYYLGQLFGATFYLHRFVSSDRERHTHNHPWGWGRALVLCGGYDEEVATDLTASAAEGYLVEKRRVRWWNRVDGSHFHRIANAKPGTWTLFFHGPRVMVDRGRASQPKGWGFLSKSEYGVKFTPYMGSDSGPRWWETAPKGRDAGRVPLCGYAARSSGAGSGCASRQHSDSMACEPCAISYDVNDPHPPRCPANLRAMAAAYGASPSSGSPDDLYAEAAKLVKAYRVADQDLTRDWRLTPRPSLSLGEQTVGRVSRIVTVPCVLVGARPESPDQLPPKPTSTTPAPRGATPPAP